MPYLRETPDWETAIYEISTVDPVLGGTDGISNLQATQLANRTQWLKAQSENQGQLLTKQATAIDENGLRIEENDHAIACQHALLVAHGVAADPHPRYYGQYRGIADGGADHLTAVFDCEMPDPPADMTMVFIRARFSNENTAPLFSPQHVLPRVIVKGDGKPLKKGDIAGPGYPVMLQYDANLDKWLFLNPSWGNESETMAPVGAMMYWPLPEPPSGWLERDGALLSRTAYADLFAVVGTRYGAGDGITTFQLPDDRALFERGWDHGLGIDEARGFGTIQGDAIRNITGSMLWVAGYGDTPEGALYGQSGRYNQWHGAGYTNSGKILFDASRVVPTAPENRPRNRAYLPIIKYR